MDENQAPLSGRGRKRARSSIKVASSDSSSSDAENSTSEDSDDSRPQKKRYLRSQGGTSLGYENTDSFASSKIHKKWKRCCSENVFREDKVCDVQKGTKVGVYHVPGGEWKIHVITSIRDGVAEYKNPRQVRRGKLKLNLNDPSLIWRSFQSVKESFPPTWQIPGEMREIHISMMKKCTETIAKQGDSSLTLRNGTTVDMTSYIRLKPNVWLEDTILMAFITTIISTCKHKEDVRLTTINSQVWKYMVSKDHERLSVILRGLPLHCFDCLLIPLLLEKDQHWVLAYADVRDRKFTIFDPYRPSQSEKISTAVIETLRVGLEILTSEQDKIFGCSSQWQMFPSCQIAMDYNFPVQSSCNCTDCGVLVCAYAWSLGSGVSWPQTGNSIRHRNNLITLLRTTIGALICTK